MADKNKNLNTFIAKFYTYKFLSVMGFIIPFVAVMFDANGLSATQIAYCMMTAFIVQFATEIPSGAIADRYSRRNVLAGSQLFAIFAYTFWLFMPYFWGYLLGYACFGLTMSLESGCDEAFLYDELKKYDKRNLYEKIQGRCGALVPAGLMIASFIASYLVKIGFDFNMLIIGTIIVYSISVAVLLTIQPAKKFKDTEEIKNALTYIQILRKGLRYSWKHATVFRLLFFVAFSSFINMGFEEYSEILYNELTHSLSKVAIIFALMEIMYAFGSLMAEFLRKISVRFLILFYLTIAIFDIIAFTIYQYPLTLAIVFFDSLVCVGVTVNMSARTNDFIPSSVRATILSVRGFIKSLGTLISLFAFGRVVDHFESYRIGFLTFAYLFTIGSAIFTIIFWMDKHLKKRERRLK